MQFWPNGRLNLFSWQRPTIFLVQSIASTLKMSYLDPSKALEYLKDYPTGDGLSAADLMDSRQHGGLTYNDFLVLPGKIEFSASQVSTDTRVTRNVTLKTPFMSSPMDTVTEEEMAINVAVSLPTLHVECCILITKTAHGRYRCYPS